ncbi:MAG: two-component regulator propeller domain-containing protein, partial [Candidatus Cryptobacteroides sp.]
MNVISAKTICIMLLATAVSFETRLQAFGNAHGLPDNLRSHEVPGRFVCWDSSDGLPSDKVLFIMEDEDGILWLCTDRGLCRFDGTLFHNYGGKVSYGPLRDCRTRCTAPGPEGTLWVGTESGLEKFDKINGISETVQAVCGEDGKTIAIKSLFTDSDGSLWMHADNGAIIHYNPENQYIESTDFKGAYFEGDYYYDHIFKDRNERLWVGGRATSVAKIENGDISTCTWPIPNPDTEHFEGSAFAEDSQGTFYATDDKGLLSVYDSGNNIFRTFSHIPIAAVCATTDHTGRIWFGGRNGLIRMNSQMDGFDWFRHTEGDDNSVASNNIYCLYTDRRGNVWAGTDKGLSVFPNINNAVIGFGMENGLSSDSVTALMQDKDGLLWIGTEENGADTLNL